MRTQVGIIGAGPAGLMLSHLLHLAGIESIVIENRSRDYIENRMRAGLIENWVADMLVDVGVGARHAARRHAAWGINIGINGELHRIDFTEADRQARHIYDQKEVVKDLIAQRLADGGQFLFEVDDVSVHDFDRRRSRKSASRMTARRRRSIAISSPAATASTASAGRAFRTAC